MRYELLLQSATPGTPFATEAVEAQLATRQVTQRPDGGREWRLPQGVVELSPLSEAGVQVATVLGVDLSGKQELVRELVLEASQLAREAGVSLFDPQLMRPLAPADGEAVAEQYLRTARYAGQIVGLPEAVDVGFSAAEPPGTRVGVKVLLGLLAVFFLALQALDWVLAP